MAATVGDPSGIGPEVASKTLATFLEQHSDLTIHLFGSVSLKHPRLLQKNLDRIYKPGRPSKKTGEIAIQNLKEAANFCLKKEGRSLVTGPVDKRICAKSVKGFTGQTGYLQKICESKGTTMVLKGDGFSVALVTTHVPLKKVSSKLTKKLIIKTTERYREFLCSSVKEPKIAVLALNPHASDHGLLGKEEAQIIKPALLKLQKKFSKITGPHPADTLFHRVKEFDGVVAMYHDQGLIPLKMSHFYDAVNISLGLPFFRVSVDHGTAFDIAGKNQASSLSYQRALEHAYDWSQKKTSQKDKGQIARHRHSRRARA